MSFVPWLATSSRYISRFPTIRATVSAIMASVSFGRMLWRVANSLT